jgi:hypothetical protein
MYKAEQMAELQAEKDALEAQRKQSEEMMAQLLAMQQQMAQQNQGTAAPAQQEGSGPDMAAMMAELQALRAQVAKQEQPEEQKESKVSEEDAMDLENIVQEFGSEEEHD